MIHAFFFSCFCLLVCIRLEGKSSSFYSILVLSKCPREGFCFSLCRSYWYLWTKHAELKRSLEKNSCQDWKVHFLPLSGREISKLMTGLSSFAKLTVPMSHQLVTCTISVSISSRHWQLVFPKLRFGGDCPNMIYLGVVFQFILLLAPKHINILLFVII